MAGGILNVASGVQTIDALLGRFKWTGPNLTYNFPDMESYYGDLTVYFAGTDPTFAFPPFGAATASLQTAITHGITTQLMAVAPLVYTLNAPDAAADSSFAMASLNDDDELMMPPGGIGYYPGMIQVGGDAWFNIDQDRFNDVDIGDSAYWIVLHELGHSVGLKHGHANDRPGPTMDLLPDAVNSFEFSIMTYHRYVGDTFPFNQTEEGSFPQSLMMYDIAAIQYMYGANFDHNSGNTIYMFSPTTGEMFVDGVGQGTPEINRIFRTIWDGNGNDTYDLSNYTTDLEIDLAPGGWSDFNSGQLALLNIPGGIFARGNVFNALQFNGDPRSLIENAIGGSGNDTILGNGAANILVGNDGTDHLSGRDGADLLVGGAGGDVLDGGAAFDFAAYLTSASGVTALLSAPAGNAGDAAGDSYVSVEGLIGSNSGDWLAGDAGFNILVGNGGNDALIGLAGSDRLLGGAGFDALLGGAHDDALDGGAGGDALVGGPGFDYAFYESSLTGLTASLMNPAANTGDAAGDTYSVVEGIVGSHFDDVLSGNNSINEVRGGLGNDTLSGLGGNDHVEGGAGNDTLSGGFGNDRFVFRPGFGSDTITDWDDFLWILNDVISFQGTGLSMADLAISYAGGDATVSVIGTKDEIHILDVRPGSITAEDFLF